MRGLTDQSNSECNGASKLYKHKYLPERKMEGRDRYKLFITQVRSLEEDGKLLEELRELQLRHQSKTPIQGACSDSNRRSQGEASGRHKCKAAERHAQQQLKLEEQPEQQIRRVSRRHKADEQSLEQQPRSKTHTPKHWEQPQHHDHERKTSQRQRAEQQPTPQQENQQKSSLKPVKKHLSQTGKTEKPPSHQQQNNEATSSTRQDGHQHPSNHQRDNNQDKRERRRPRKEKKDQGSQTRMSGPPRPRRLLVAQQLKKQTRSSQEQPRTRFRLSDDLITDNSSSDTHTNSAASHGKQVSRTVQSGTDKDQGRNSTSSRERSRGLNTSHENSQQVPALTRRKSFIDLDDLNIENHQHKRLVNTENERPNQQLDPGTKTKVQLIQHQVQVHHGALRDAPQSHQQENETQRSHQQERHPSDHSHPAPHVNQHHDHYADLPPEQFANPQEYEQSIPKTKVTRQEAEVLKLNNSESQTQSDQNRKSAHDRQLQDSERTVASQGGGRHVAPSGRSRSGGPHAHEAQSEGHSGKSLEREGTIKSQSGESLTRQSQREYTVESQSGMRSRSSERGHPSASTDRRQTRSSLERAHPGPSLEGGRDLTDEKEQRHQAVKYPSVEHVNRERPAEHVHHDPLLQSFRSVPSSLHRMHHELPARYVHRARVVEYTRHEPPLDRLRQDMRAGHQPYIEVGRAGSAIHREHSISYTERGHRLYPVRDRYTSGARDHGYTSDTSDPGRIRLYGERRYDGGYVDASHAGSYSEYTSRSLEPSYPRLYSDRALYRSEEPDHARLYSERSHAGKYLEPYPDRILSERWRHTSEWEDREKGHYKEMITPLNAPTQPLDHRAL
ncbi:involucrin-like [Procambarus clarkii]|uniref:involucrin-like n=1 Tax=Procambarus clarkii TaxID=6728 RepID=UPI003742E6B2